MNLEKLVSEELISVKEAREGSKDAITHLVSSRIKNIINYTNKKINTAMLIGKFDTLIDRFIDKNEMEYFIKIMKEAGYEAIPIQYMNDPLTVKISWEEKKEKDKEDRYYILIFRDDDIASNNDAKSVLEGYYLSTSKKECQDKIAEVSGIKETYEELFSSDRPISICIGDDIIDYDTFEDFDEKFRIMKIEKE